MSGLTEACNQLQGDGMQQKWYLSTQGRLNSLLSGLSPHFSECQKNKSGFYATVVPHVHLQRLKINVIEYSNYKVSLQEFLNCYTFSNN